MKSGILSRPRECAAVLAAAGLLWLAFAGKAAAETYHASTTAQFVEAVTKANANPGANTIVLTAGAYLPEKTQTFTNTGGVQTVEGPTAFPPAKLEGTSVTPFPSELFVINTGVSVTFKRVAISTAGGSGVPAVDDFGTLTVESSLVAGNNGPGVHVEPGATSTVRNSTLSDGLDFGLVDNGTASLFNSTVAFNKAGGVENKGTLNLTNTIVADNTGAGDCAGAATTTDHSLDSDSTCGVGTLSKTNPLLASLANNGGPTSTHALQVGSPAIDAGDTTMCPATDQRGFPRPDVASTACDIGAYEFQVPPHYYVNGAKVKEGAAAKTYIAWGNITLKGTKGSISGGHVTCHNAVGGSLLNPLGAAAGEGQVQVFAPFACEQELFCPAKTTAVAEKAENLPWHSLLTEEVPFIIRQESTGVKLNVQCFEGALTIAELKFAVPAIERKGLRPKTVEGTEALHPGLLEVDSESGEMELEGSGGGTLGRPEGAVKLLGYNAQELIAMKKP